MARLDRKRGRFSADFETNEIHKALGGYQSGWGDRFDYFRFESESSVMHDLYDEGTGVGRVYTETKGLPALHIVHEEGANQDTDTGFYFNDDLHITASFDQLVRAGLSKADLEHHNYLKDRIVYDGRVFRVLKIAILGQIQRRDVIVAIEATQVKPDEMVNDQQFAGYAV